MAYPPKHVIIKSVIAVLTIVAALIASSFWDLKKTVQTSFTQSFKSMTYRPSFLMDRTEPYVIKQTTVVTRNATPVIPVVSNTQVVNKTVVIKPVARTTRVVKAKIKTLCKRDVYKGTALCRH